MGGYKGSTAEREDLSRLQRLEQSAAQAANACHDWLMAHPDARRAPTDMRIDVDLAEETLAAHKRDMAAKRFADQALEGAVMADGAGSEFDLPDNADEWGDCNKCGEVSCVNPDDDLCDYCGCNTPFDEHPEAEWVKGENP